VKDRGSLQKDSITFILVAVSGAMGLRAENVVLEKKTTNNRVFKKTVKNFFIFPPL
jgi:hypothetical protein